MGGYDGNWRAILDHRRQWQSIAVPYLTSAFLYSHKFYPSFEGKRILAGLNYIHDKSGDAKLSINQIELSAAYEHDYLNNTFKGGIQLSYIHKQFSADKLTFPQQYDRNIGGFNSELPSGEVFPANKLSMIAFNIGLAWEKRINPKWTTTVATSIFNFNQPQESFMEQDFMEKASYGIQAFANYKWLPKTQLRPSLEYRRNSAASELILGSNIHQKIEHAKIDGMFGGLHVRNGFGRNMDAVILNAGLAFKRFDFGAIYDFNVSDLHIASNYKGGFEFIIILNDVSAILEQKSLLCERF